MKKLSKNFFLIKFLFIRRRQKMCFDNNQNWHLEPESSDIALFDLDKIKVNSKIGKKIKSKKLKERRKKEKEEDSSEEGFMEGNGKRKRRTEKDDENVSDESMTIEKKKNKKKKTISTK